MIYSTFSGARPPSADTEDERSPKTAGRFAGTQRRAAIDVARAKHDNADGTVLVGYRPERGADEKYCRLPNRTFFDAFCKIEKEYRRLGRPIPHPDFLFGFVDSIDNPEQSDEKATRKSRGYRLGEYVGTVADPGPYQEHRDEPRPPQRFAQIVGVLNRYAVDILDMPMAQVGRFDARQVTARMYVCLPCVKRAIKAKRDDIVADQFNRCDARKDPWDGACVDLHGNSTHYPRLARNTIKANLNFMREIFKTAANAATDPAIRDERCANIRDTEVRRLKMADIPYRPTNDRLARNLSYYEVQVLQGQFPTWLDSIVEVGADGMFRPGELCPIQRGNITWQATGSGGNTATIILTHTSQASGKIVLRGKNRLALGTPVHLGESVSGMLRQHLDAHRSNPSPATCPACAAGYHEMPATTNRHVSGCDFANDAFVWIDPDSKPISSTDLRAIMKDAVETSKLDFGGWMPTPKCLRMTGATLHLDANVPLPHVAKMGRWADERVLMKHYYRARDDLLRASAAKVDEVRRAAIGSPVDATLAADKQNEQLRARVATLEETVWHLRSKQIDNG